MYTEIPQCRGVYILRRVEVEADQRRVEDVVALLEAILVPCEEAIKVTMLEATVVAILQPVHDTVHHQIRRFSLVP